MPVIFMVRHYRERYLSDYRLIYKSICRDITCYFSIILLIKDTTCYATNIYFIILNSVRRFFWRPSSVVLGAMGLSNPYPTLVRRSLAIPF